MRSTCSTACARRGCRRNDAPEPSAKGQDFASGPGLLAGRTPLEGGKSRNGDGTRQGSTRLAPVSTPSTSGTLCHERTKQQGQVTCTGCLSDASGASRTTVAADAVG